MPSPAAWGTVPMRLFLGVTFVYAGLQKLFDPGFLSPGSPTYIGTQLNAFAAHSPIGFLITAVALPLPLFTGAAVLAGELGIGALVLLGIQTRLAAAAGALLNFVLFLTASWTVQPYFLGSDGIYTVAWITLAVVGDQGLLRAGPFLLRQLGLGQGRPQPPTLDPGRRRLLLQLGGAAVGLVWVLSILPRRRTTATVSALPSPSPAPSATPLVSPSPTGTRIGSLTGLRSQGFLRFNDPATGDSALVVQLSNGNVVAYDAICTHAGCEVDYDSGSKLFVCPCHGAEFDPAHGANVVAGPAPSPLPSIKVEVAADGSIYTH